MSTRMNADPHTTIIDMTPDGGFREPQRAGWNVRATGWTALAAVIGAAVLGLVLVVWLAITVLPIVLALALIGVVVSRLRGRRRRGIMAGPFARRF
jgi:Flp pilus assembly protein TadB